MRREIITDQLARDLARIGSSIAVPRMRDNIVEGSETRIGMRLITEYIKSCALAEIACKRMRTRG